MNTNLIASIFYEHWATWQDIVFFVGLAMLGLLFFSLLAFIVFNNARWETTGKRVGKRVEWYEERMALERKTLEAEEEKARLELEQRRNELSEKQDALVEAEGKANQVREQVTMKEKELRALFEQSELNRRELAEYQKREGTYVPDDVVVNILTERVIEKSEYKMDSASADCKIPESITINYSNEDVIDYISQKPESVKSKGRGNSSAFYKVNNISFAFLDIKDGYIELSFKCGTNYCTKLSNTLRGIVKKAEFPSGLLWYTVTNKTQPGSLELIKLLIDISYRIAKSGY